MDEAARSEPNGVPRSASSAEARPMLVAMPVELIVGPPNSGRAQELRRRIEPLLERDPLLVVPTADDAARFERELCEAAGGGIVGVSIRTFGSLFDSAADAAGLAQPPALSPPQRLALVRAAVRATPLRLLRRSSARPGFAPALDSLIGEFQAALLDPEQIELAARELDQGDYEAELAALYSSYVALRDRAGRSDAGSRAANTLAALRSDPSRWAGAPLFVYGFDDLTRAQLELISTLAASSSILVAVNYSDRDALSARAGLLATLREELGARESATLPHDPSHAESAALRHLDAALFEPDATRIEPDEGIALLDSAGELGEAEAIGAEIARLLAAGEPADSIAVVVRDPATRGPLIGRTLERFSIPVAVEARAPLAGTAVGRSLAALCRALDGDEPTALLEHLRGDPATPAGIADSLELRLRRERPATLEKATAGWRAQPRHLSALRGAGDPAARMRALAAIALELAQAPHARLAPLAGRAGAGSAVPFDPVEQRAAVAAAELVGELAEIGALPGCEPPDLSEAAEAIESASVALWRGPTDGRVRVLDPYRIRAGRARHLFVAGLQEGEFPRRSPGDPLLSDERRAHLGLETLRRRDSLEEERYLFHACVSRPSERLWLSWQSADDDGAPAARSPFVDEVLDLLGSDPGEAAASLTRRRGLERVVFTPAEAPSERELARALALREPRARERRPGPLEAAAVLDELGERELLSASTLERWLGCSYRWFVEHELAPQRLDPESDALRLGSVAHDALEQLYREPPGAEAIPRPADLGRWLARLAELLTEKAPEHGIDPERPGDAIAIARLRAQIEAFLREEAESDLALRPSPELLEAGFGFDEDRPALEIGEAKLRGRIDRIDLDADGSAALVRDYKTSAKIPGRGAWENHGKLQLQLYILAARERFGLEPIGGLYTALGARGERRPRGMLLRGDPRLESIDAVRGDPCSPEDFEAELERARAQAGEIAGAMRAGRIDRDPLGGKCPRYCTFQPICRLERAIGLEDEQPNGAAEGG